MKKNKILRIASCLLIAVLLSTCAISGTFAKYTTQDASGDTARVAKWGVTVAVTGDGTNEGFETAYGTTVASSNTESVVAPGTEGNLGSITITGAPEVSVKMTYVIDFEIGETDDWTVEGVFYCPIAVTVKTGTVINGTSYTTADEFEQAVENAIAAELTDATDDTTDGTYEKTLDPNTSVAGSVAPTWAWAFETTGVTFYSYTALTEAATFETGKYFDANKAAVDSEPADWATNYANYFTRTALDNDALDTALGNNAAAGNAATISFSYSVTATQVTD